MIKNNFVIVTEDTTDLPISYFEEHNVGVISLHCMMDDTVYTIDNPLDPKTFFQGLREGKLPTTSQINPSEAEEFYEKYLAKGMDVLHLAFSSGLSGTYNSALVGAEAAMEKYPSRKVVVIDTLCASLGEGLLVDYAVKLRDAGKSLEEIVDWVEGNKHNLTHLFVVDDLFHLYRGGRVSRLAAIFGSMASIKPVMHVDDDGRLTLVTKARGRKKSIQMLVELMDERLGANMLRDQEVFISHGDCLEEAEYLASLIKEKFGFDAYINYLGTTIGTHTGCGVIALFFIGEKR